MPIVPPNHHPACTCEFCEIFRLRARVAELEAQPTAKLLLEGGARIRELETLLTDILDDFQFPGHPGEPCHRSGWVRDETLAKWRGILNRK